MSAIPSHPKCPWMPAMSREAPLHFHSKQHHMRWLEASLGAKRLVEDPEFRDLMEKLWARWRKDGSPMEANYAKAWEPILAADGEESARILMAHDANGAIARHGLPDGFALFDQATRVSIRIKAEEQFEDGFVTYSQG